jgi:hypothetical protein
MKKYNYIYHTEIENLKTGVVKHYFGKHRSNRLNDSYSGSGYYMRHVKKYPERYKISVRKLEFFSTYELASNAEALYIKAGKIKYGSLCMNLSDGGEGGTVYKSTRVKNSNHAKKLWATPGHRDKVSASMKKTLSNPVVKARNGMASKLSQQRPEVKEKQRNNTIKALARSDVKARHIAGIKAAKRAHLENWKFFEELYLLWKNNGKVGYRRFNKLAVKNGYPDEPYGSMINEFKLREN